MSSTYSDTMDESDYESEQFHDDEDYMFEPVVPESKTKKNYKVDFKSYSPEDILKTQTEEISHVSTILGCSSDNAAILLRYFKWDKEKLIESFMENDAKVMKDAGVNMDHKELRFKKIPDFVCDICCDDSDSQAFSLACEHYFGGDCYRQYIEQKISEGESRHIVCPGDCDLIVDRESIEFLVNPKTLEKYNLLLLRTYVDDLAYLKWCPFPNCENAVECKVKLTDLDKIVPSVECLSGHKFCFGCSGPDHQPVTCQFSKLWLKKCADDSETSNWIAANTKECSNCGSTIEKNGGCNHMTCRKCKFEFCWICQGPWADHGTSWYNCNRYEEKESIDARDLQAKSRSALERYLHYYNRYANHEQSAKLDKELYERTERQMDSMQQSSDFSWIQVQFLKGAVDILLKARQTLMWTYCLGYYLTRKVNSTEIFEDNQRDLEMAVEALSGLLETPITRENAADIRKQVLDKAEYVNRRQQVLLTDTAEGHLEGRWQYTL